MELAVDKDIKAFVVYISYIRLLVGAENDLNRLSDCLKGLVYTICIALATRNQL